MISMYAEGAWRGPAGLRLEVSFSLVLFTVLFGLILVSDRLLKLLALAHLGVGRPIVLLPFLHLNLTFNTGAAFGLFPNLRVVLAALGVVVTAGAFYAALRLSRAFPGDRGLLVGTALVAGGAAGNLADRLLYGYVVDFVDLRVWPVFNLADSLIVVGALYLAWRLAAWRRPEGGG